MNIDVDGIFLWTQFQPWLHSCIHACLKMVLYLSSLIIWFLSYTHRSCHDLN